VTENLREYEHLRYIPIVLLTPVRVSPLSLLSTTLITTHRSP